MSISRQGRGAGGPGGSPIPPIVLGVVAGALAAMAAFELGLWPAREAPVPAARPSAPAPAALSVVPQAPPAPSVASVVPAATRQPLEAIAPAAVGNGRSHALLVRPGMRFQTLASDILAVHGPVAMEMWVKIVEPGEGVIEVRLHNFESWLRGRRVTFLAQSAHTAVNEAARKVDEEVQQKIGGLTCG